MARSIGGGAFDFALVIESGLVNQKNTLAVVRNDSGTSAAENLETVFKPRDLRQRRARKLYNKLGLHGEKF